MNFKEILFFIARALTISTNKVNRKWVINKIEAKNICWDKVVTVSTQHYVLPALYCSFKKNNLLHFLPVDLVEYAAHITNLNKIRNKKIIEQLKEINNLLINNNITPVYIKGSSFLLQNLYDNISERMIGDIDLLVEKKDCLKASAILVNNGYTYNNKNYNNIELSDFRHLPRLTKSGKIAAIEVHHELILKEYRSEFKAQDIFKNHIKTVNNFNFMTYEKQIALCILSTQVNNGDSIFIKKIGLRYAYDIFLLSKKTNSLEAIKGFKLLFKPLNDYLAITQYTLSDNNIKIQKTTSAIKSFNKYFLETKNNKLKRKILLVKLFFIDLRLRKKILSRIARKSWRTQKLIELRLKNR